MNTTKIGKRAEAVARAWYGARGYRVLEQNVRTRFFELDLILEDTDVIVFVEVKYRSSPHYGGGIGAVRADKQRRLTVGALCWLADMNLMHRSVRFDVLEIISDGPYEKILHVENCFAVDSVM